MNGRVSRKPLCPCPVGEEPTSGSARDRKNRSAKGLDRFPDAIISDTNIRIRFFPGKGFRNQPISGKRVRT
jgi:hypothetical protein